MKKVVTFTKVAKLLKLYEVVADLKSHTTDEEIIAKYNLTWAQLTKVYSKLFYGGHIDLDDLVRRLDMRGDKDASHIPLVRLDGTGGQYECWICGYSSAYHFSSCPRCKGINLRRLHKQSPPEPWTSQVNRLIAGP